MAIPAETLREATLQMADWLEQHEFRATAVSGCDPELTESYVRVWVDGYRRAIFELRRVAEPPVVVPDDIGELEP